MPAPLDPGMHQALEALVIEHSWLIDHGRAGKAAALYADDGCVYGIGSDKVGRPAISAWLDARQATTDRRSRHVISNVRFAPVAADEVHGSAVLTLFRHDGAGPGSATPLLVAEYEDVFRRGADGTWQFASRRLTTLFGAG